MNKALDIVKYILTQCAIRNQPINCVHLNYIMYNLQENYLRNYDKLLFEEDFYAWDKGCIIPEVYNVFCGYGGSKIPNTYNVNIPIAIKDFIDINIGIVDLPMWVLLERMQKSNSPYTKVWNNGKGKYHIIPKELIKQKYIK